MALRQTKKISELPALSVASLDTTFVLGISGSTTYKISINNLTSSLDTTFATDLVTSALSSSLSGKLSTSSFNSYTSSFTASVASGTISGSSQLTSSFDQRYVVSGSITQTTWDNIANKPSGIVSQSTDLSSLNTFTASISTASLVNRLNAIESISGSWITESETGSFLTSLSGAISSSTQISDLGFVTGSYTTINSFNSLTQSFNSISQSFTTISGSVGGIDFSTLAITGSNIFIGGQTISGSLLINSKDVVFTNRLYVTASSSIGNPASNDALISVGGTQGDIQLWPAFFSINYRTGLNNEAKSGFNYESLYFSSSFGQHKLEHIDGNFDIDTNIIISGSLNVSGSITGSTNFNTIANKPTLISGSSQLTSSYDTRYVISGSVGATPSGTISGSSQLTSSFDTRYAASGSVGSSVNTASLATTGSNSFNGNQTITGSLVVSAVAVVNGGITIPTGSVISLTSGSSLFVDISGAITGSLTGSVFGIGDVVAFSASVNSRIISGSAVAGTISGSSQLTSSYDSRYSLSGSVLTSFSSSVDTRLDTLEASIITGSPNYVQILGARVTGVTTLGVIIISGSITTTGNPVQIMVTGDANPITTSWTRLQLFRDNTAIGNIVQVENSSNLNVPYCLNVIDTPSAGTYTYSMRTVSAIAGTLDFGEHNGPTLTAVELKTNTNLPSTNNTFTGTNTFNNTTTFASAGGDEGGEIQFGVPVTNTTLQNRVTVDVWQNRLRFFEGSANANGVYIDLSKPITGNNNEITYKASGIVNVGTFVTLDNVKVTATRTGAGGGYAGLSVGAVSTSFTANVSATFSNSSIGGVTLNAQTYTTTASNAFNGWGFLEGHTSTYILNDTTNSRVYRITMMIGASYNNNFISIERLH